jgi:imidazolonepropionase-like amidohydrolase
MVARPPSSRASPPAGGRDPWRRTPRLPGPPIAAQKGGAEAYRFARTQWSNQPFARSATFASRALGPDDRSSTKMSTIKAITNCTVYDPASGDLLRHQTVRIDGSSIVSVAEAHEIDWRGVHVVYNALGFTVLPGLVDMHVHCTMHPGRTAAEQARDAGSREVLVENGLLAASALLDAGVTSVRDMGAGLGAAIEVRDQIAAGRVLGPRVLAAGGMITAPGGHGCEDSFRFGVEVLGGSAARAAVRGQAVAGSDFSKIAIGGGPTPAELSLIEILAATVEAHSLGQHVAAHAHFSERWIDAAILAACDSLEHGCYLSAEAAAKMAEQGTVYCPTLTVLHRILEAPDMFGGRSTRFYDRVVKAAAAHASSVRIAKAAGVRIVSGTDAGLRGVPFDSIHDELAALHACGLTVGETLRCATSSAATLPGFPATGRVKPGFLADLVVVPGDGIPALRDLRRPAAVFVGGACVRRQFLQ